MADHAEVTIHPAHQRVATVAATVIAVHEEAHAKVARPDGRRMPLPLADGARHFTPRRPRARTDHNTELRILTDMLEESWATKRIGA